MTTLQDVRNKMEWEGGIEQTFVYYSDFEEVKDDEFHHLRRAYLKAHNELEKYINSNTFGEGDE